MSKDQALAWIAEHSPMTLDGGYAELGGRLGWDRKACWRVLQSWKRMSYVTLQTDPKNNALNIDINPVAFPSHLFDGDARNDTAPAVSASLPAAQAPSAATAMAHPATVPEHPETLYVRAPSPRQPAVTAAPPTALDALASAVAIGMAIVTAYFSIHGLLTLFPGDEWGVTVFGVGVECLKVVGVMYLSRHARSLWWVWRWLAIAAVIIAAGLNSASVYAKFAALHAQAPAAAAATRDASAVDLDARIEAAQRRVADLGGRASAIDATVSGAGQRSNARGMQRVVGATRGDRDGITREQAAASQELASLKAKRGQVTAAGRQAAAEELPVTLMASLFSTDAATVLRWLVCAVVICGDPAALILLAAVGSRRKGGAA